jgi:putative ABC transport system permease protein
MIAMPRRLLARLRSVFTKPALDADFNEELAQHLEAATDDNIRAGMTPEEARRQARIALGGVDQVRELHRDARGLPWLENLGRDGRYAVRTLRRSPGFTFVAIATLALGIGANTALFSVVKALLFDSPFREPDRLLFVAEKVPEGDGAALSYPSLLEYQREPRAFASLAGFRLQSWNLTGGNEPERVDGLQASATLFATLGLQPMLGRAFNADEDRPGGAKVVVIGERLWRRRFGADPAVLGTSITLDGEPYSVIGVIPAALQVWRPADLVTPIGYSAPWTNDRQWHSIYAVGRLAPEVSIDQARAVLDTITARLAKEYPQENAGRSISLKPLRDHAVGDLRSALWVLSAVAALVLALGCVNVASLQQARGAGRLHELSVRTALGATRSRLIRQMLTENLLLGLLGSVAGLLIAHWSVKVISTMLPPIIAEAGLVRLDPAALWFGSLAGLMVGLASGVIPAWVLTMGDVAGRLKRGALGMARLGRLHVQDALVVAQVTLAVVTLVGASLMARSFARLLAVPLGIEPQGVILADLSLSWQKYPAPEDLWQFYENVLREAAQQPGVASAALMTTAPMSFVPWNAGYIIEGTPPPEPGRENLSDFAAISSDYFKTLGIRLDAGRAFDERDHARSSRAAIVDRLFVKKHFPDGNAVGKRLALPSMMGEEWLEIVGVADSVRYWGPDGESSPEIYVPLLQFRSTYLTLAVRTRDGGAGQTAALQAAVRRVDPDQPVANLRTMADTVAGTAMARRLAAKIIAGFAVIALSLAALGLYGTLSRMVIQRTREIGIRMALGAPPSGLFSLFVGRGLRLTGLGLVLGLVAAIPLVPLLSGLLFETRPGDPVAFAVVPLVLVVVAVVACWLPARRAAEVDPVIALRAE